MPLGASVVEVGNNGTKTAGTTLVVTTTAEIPSGALVVVRGAWDNTGTGTTSPTPTGTVSGASLTWTKRGERGSGSASAAGVVGGVFTAPVTTAVASGTNITLTVSASVTARNLVVEYVAGASYSAVAAVTNGATTGAATVTISPTAIGQMVHGVVYGEGDTSTAFSQDTDTTNGSWDTLPLFGTTGNNANANVVSVGGFKIVTATGAQTYNPATFTPGGADWVATAIVLTANADHLAAPTSLTATAVSSSQVNLSWTAPAGTPTSYDIERDGTVVHNTGTATTSWSDTGRTSGVTYTYRVAAVRNGVRGEWSTTAEATPPSTYTGAAASTLSPTSTSASATFTKPTDTGVAASVLPSASTAATATFTKPTDTGSAASVLSPVSSAATATFTPAGVSVAGSATTETDSAFSGAVQLASPPSLQVAVNGDDVTLTWAAVTGALDYSVERNGAIIASGLATTSYLDEDVPSGANAYRVGARY
jgi:hypothetical protein